ncbi:MAG: hypothetical protein JJU36_10100 [Phycisphaeraceae bacterium]|nr:hypothetical protein [Phycisphaeraceae bacterium]
MLQPRQITPLILLLIASMLSTGCLWKERIGRGADPILSPYQSERTWAVAPFRNESGSIHANTIRIADHVGQHFQNASYIRVLPMTRVLDIMTQLGMNDIATLEDAQRLMAALGADGLIIGSVTAYDPYDPPKLGLTIELFSVDDPEIEPVGPEAIRRLAASPTEEPARRGWWRIENQPVSSQGAYFDAADPHVRRAIIDYAARRGNRDLGNESARIYHLSIDRYSEFVTYVMAQRLMNAERLRLEARRIEQLTQSQPE